MKAGQNGRCSDREFAFVLDNLVNNLTRKGSLAGFLDNIKSMLGFAAELGLARHFRVPVRTRS